MDEPDFLTTFQVHVARIFFGLKSSEGYVVAGGAALLAVEPIARPTVDLDLKKAFRRALDVASTA